ncbi:exopolysaccharide biosynthesis polyprenyl glycosylphosphotransferase [Snuella sp. CAU 1569]|uniref:Exopolysaccharide biosynthesis polyprenyl glycosylphosphotransferase n=2 Tax=Snuella sedimenti TaxID=2798802 RepID=A0A8J7J1U7_9FLAO|nr:exopolysaccharide biosynthesis polyprenyl glycosylphosphotransferase [Snuella sedimenti]
MLIVFDLSVINGFAYWGFANIEYVLVFHGVISFSWLLSAVFFKYYEVYRFTSELRIVSLLIKQFFFLTLVLFAFWGFYSVDVISKAQTFQYVYLTLFSITLGKFVVYYALKKYRAYYKGNNRNVLIVGNSLVAEQLKTFFEERRDLGYILKGFVSPDLQATNKNIEAIKNGGFDEIYCAIDDLSEDQVRQYIKVANERNMTLKFISNTNSLVSKKMHIDYYDYLPVLSFQRGVINIELNKVIKRLFDIVFSLIVIVCVLSWLVPLLGILIKLESKGPVFFKHQRNGVNYKEFTCYKFRSLKIIEDTNVKHVREQDPRLTRLGKFIRRISIDELPQFFNVLIGDMSVVGPRPHMPVFNDEYAKVIDAYDFMFRHTVKPGITGLAQVSGCRGEIENDKDIINRVKYDIFYIENWSLLLDIKIIVQTFLNAIKGEEKAY